MRARPAGPPVKERPRTPGEQDCQTLPLVSWYPAANGASPGA